MNRFDIAILLCVLTLSSCMDKNNGGAEGLLQEKIIMLKKFFFIYDLECVDMTSRERADTTFMMVLPEHKNAGPYIMYVATGDCSYCIGTVLDFLRVCAFVGEEQYRPNIAIKNSLELFRYYLKEDGLEDAVYETEIIELPEGTNVPDGMYLIYRNRIINYASWEI